jgi:hypothetical protein
MTTKEKVSRPRIDEAKFIKVWAKVHNKGGHLQDVADEIGCSHAGASTKAKSLIEAGIKLPKLERAPRKSGRDVKALNEVLKAELSK